MAKISITRALVELKRYDQRITQALSQSTFGVVATGTGEKQKVVAVGNSAKFNSAKLAEEAINGSIQSVRKLIDNRAAVKAAIIKSNANTFLTFNGKNISVAEAIELKTSVAFMNQLKFHLSSQLTRARNDVITNDLKLESNIQSQINAILGNGDKKTAESASLIETVTNTQNALYKQSVVAEDHVAKTLETVTSEISAIEAELDFALSEINAQTLIDVEL